MNGFHRLHALRMENDETRGRMDNMRPRFAALAARHENGTAPRAVSAYQLFQTPPETAARMAEVLELKAGARVLEPSAGLGRLLDAIQPFEPGHVVAMEIARDLAGELYRQERERVQLKARDFLAETPAEWAPFDAVIMNPPFHMRSDIKHIEHALGFLKPGGRLVALCMDTKHRRDAFQHRAATWEEIPAGAFKSEGTNVPTILFSILKS